MRYALYPGCSLESSSVAYDMSVKQVAATLPSPSKCLFVSPAGDRLVITAQQDLRHGESAILAGPGVLSELEQSISAGK